MFQDHFHAVYPPSNPRYNVLHCYVYTNHIHVLYRLSSHHRKHLSQHVSDVLVHLPYRLSSNPHILIYPAKPTSHILHVVRKTTIRYKLLHLMLPLNPSIHIPCPKVAQASHLVLISLEAYCNAYG